MLAGKADWDPKTKTVSVTNTSSKDFDRVKLTPIEGEKRID